MVAVIDPPLTVNVPGPATFISAIPMAAPPAPVLTVLSVTPSAPMATALRLIPVPVKPVIWLTALVAVTAMLPPPVALKAVLVPVEAVMPPSKRMMPVPLVVRLMPWEVSVTRPLRSTVPPSRLVTSTDLAEVPEVVSVAPMVTLPLSSSTSSARMVAVIDPPLTVNVPGPATLVSEIPMAAPAGALLTVLRVKPAAPMATPLRSTPVPVKLVIWLMALVAVIVPPPLAVNVAPAGRCRQG